MTNINKYENLLDDPVPDIRVEVLTPQRCLLVQAVPSYFQYASDDSVKKYAKNKWNSWVNCRPHSFRRNEKNILKLYNPPDEPVPEIKVPVLTPQQAPSYFQYASDDSVKKYAKNK